MNKKLVSDMTIRFLQIYPYLKQRKTVKTLADFTASIGLNNPNYYDIKTGKRQLSVNHITELIQRYKISPNWLFLGKGEMLTNEVLLNE